MDHFANIYQLKLVVEAPQKPNQQTKKHHYSLLVSVIFDPCLKYFVVRDQGASSAHHFFLRALSSTV